ncbi:MAG TPA: adenosylmethionine--8-amino-7-oxononanoate transaminase [Polyangiaceae bacterium]|nr:adenosylmethionine--8-amino-7-oxononanoate transaminase [Polyangiaceae bacterium]
MTPRSRIVELDKRFVWHPYTPMQAYLEQTEPLVIARAEGARLFDADGRSYLDANSSWWCALLGHRHPRLVSALAEQAASLAHVALAGITHEPAALLASELCGLAPAGLEHVFFSDNGSTAVEAALKMALQFFAQNGAPERRRFVALEGAFHGETLGVTALGGIEVFRRPFAGVLLDCLHVPRGEDGAERAFAALEEYVTQHAGELAGVVLEPVLQGAAGMQLHSPALLRKARELTERAGALLVFDEVFTGFGRTGPMWASEHAGVSPDLLCLAKGLTGGMLPMAATLATRRVFEGFFGDASRAFHYGHTYCGNPLGARLGLEVLAIYRDERILERTQGKAERISRCFTALGELPGVHRPRSLGMVGAIDLGTDGGYLERAGWRVYEEALRRGAYLRPLGNVVYIAPPLNIPDADLDELLGIVSASVRAVVG